MAKDEITQTRKSVILALADCNMRANAAARKLFLDNSCVLYHIKIIKAITGKDPRKFYDFVDLVEMVNSGNFGEYYGKV